MQMQMQMQKQKQKEISVDYSTQTKIPWELGPPYEYEYRTLFNVKCNCKCKCGHCACESCRCRSLRYLLRHLPLLSALTVIHPSFHLLIYLYLKPLRPGFPDPSACCTFCTSAIPKYSAECLPHYSVRSLERRDSQNMRTQYVVHAWAKRQ